MLDGRLTPADFDDLTISSAKKLTSGTIKLWKSMKLKMLPTPAKFYYVFNIQDLGRVFHRILLTLKESIVEGRLHAKEGNLPNFPPQNMLKGLCKHECDHMFCDKLTNDKDKKIYESFLRNIGEEEFSEELP